MNAKGGFVATSEKSFGKWNGRSNRFEELIAPEPDLPENRFNDGAVGPDGYFWAGTMCEQVDLDAPPPGSFYRFVRNVAASCLENNLYISNGLGWSPDRKYFYLTDSPIRTIYRYEYENTSGEITNSPGLGAQPGGTRRPRWAGSRFRGLCVERSMGRLESDPL